MNRVKVSSANLLEVGYDPLSQRLEVVFRAAPHLLYTYRGVDVGTYQRVMAGPSVGENFNREVRTKPARFPYSKRKI